MVQNFGNGLLSLKQKNVPLADMSEMLNVTVKGGDLTRGHCSQSKGITVKLPETGVRIRKEWDTIIVPLPVLAFWVETSSQSSECQPRSIALCQRHPQGFQSVTWTPSTTVENYWCVFVEVVHYSVQKSTQLTSFDNYTVLQLGLWSLVICKSINQPGSFRELRKCLV